MRRSCPNSKVRGRPELLPQISQLVDTTMRQASGVDKLNSTISYPSSWYNGITIIGIFAGQEVLHSWSRQGYTLFNPSCKTQDRGDKHVRSLNNLKTSTWHQKRSELEALSMMKAQKDMLAKMLNRSTNTINRWKIAFFANVIGIFYLGCLVFGFVHSSIVPILEMLELMA